MKSFLTLLPDPILSLLTSEFGLSEDKIENLILYEKLLLKWNQAYNLIGPHEFSRLWERHIIDSLQLLKYLPSSHKKQISILDFGSGAGFPGIILAIAGYKNVILVEKLMKKCQFLRTVSRETRIHFEIHQEKLESLSLDQKVDVVTSRALASLVKLLEYSNRFIAEDGYCLFLKGNQLESELSQALKKFTFKYQLFFEETYSKSTIIKIWNINRF